MPNDLEGRKVSCLIDGNDKWKEEFIRRNFFQSNANAILNTPHGSSNSNDNIYKCLDSKGIFIVKSVYLLASNLNRSNEASSSSLMSQKVRWKSLRITKVFSKAKIFVWRILKELIPSNKNLWEKKLLMILVVSFVRVHRNYLSILFGTIGLLKEFGWLLFLMLICLLCLARSTQTVYFFRNWLLRICVKKRSLKSFSCNGGFGLVMYSVVKNCRIDQACCFIRWPFWNLIAIVLP